MLNDIFMRDFSIDFEVNIAAAILTPYSNWVLHIKIQKIELHEKNQ